MIKHSGLVQSFNLAKLFSTSSRYVSIIRVNNQVGVCKDKVSAHKGRERSNFNFLALGKGAFAHLDLPFDTTAKTNAYLIPKWASHLLIPMGA